MATTKLILQKPYESKRKKDGSRIPATRETRLYCFLIIDRKQVVKIKTEHTILPTEWDFRNQAKKEALAGSIEFNKRLRHLKDDIQSKYQGVIEKYPDMPFSQVSTILKAYGKKLEVPFTGDDKTFSDVLEEYILFLKGEASPRTIQKFGTLQKSLVDFGDKFSETSEKETGKKNDKYKTLSFSMINKTFRTDFTRYLREREPRGRQKSRPQGKQKGLLNDTIGKYIETLKTFLTWAEEYPTEENPYNKFTAYKKFSNSGTKREKRAEDIVTLTMSELRQFYTHDFSGNPSLERVRDLFCFACFTGQRWSDIERLDKSEIHGDAWIFNAYKTKKDTEIYLTGYAGPALDILKKYDYQLPKISLQKFNLYLKDAAEVAGISAPVTIRRYVGKKEIKIVQPKHAFLGSHAGRRTCVSILLNDYNMNISHVKEITGHEDLDTLQRYINSDNQSRRKAMSETASIIEPLRLIKQGEAV